MHVLQRRNRTTGSDWVAETHAYPLAAAASGVRHRASNSSIYHVDHDMYDGAPALPLCVLKPGASTWKSPVSSCTSAQSA